MAFVAAAPKGALSALKVRAYGPVSRVKAFRPLEVIWLVLRSISWLCFPAIRLFKGSG